MATYFGKTLARTGRVAGTILLVLVLAAPTIAAAQTVFGGLVVFGDSLSDPGNVFALQHEVSTPPYDTLDPLLIPDAPYAKGGHHFSNGATWIEQLARTLGMAGDTRPAFQRGGSPAANYAVGGARAIADGFGIDLSAQVIAFLSDAGGQAPAASLYVVAIGGNDIRDALEVLSTGGDAAAVISGALTQVGNSITALYAAGARTFLIWNTPNLRWTPALRALDSVSPGAGQAAEYLGQSYNAGLEALLWNLSQLSGIEIKRFDAFGAINAVVADPLSYGLDVADAACVTPASPPFHCTRPDAYLFWDGIHPTESAHGILAGMVADLLAQ